MGRPTTSGLYKRGGVWHIDKRIKGHGRLCGSTGQSRREDAEAVLEARICEIRNQAQRPPHRLWRHAATKYLTDNADKRSIARDAQDLAFLDPHIGDTPLDHVHMGTLQPAIAARQQAGQAASTINRMLAVVRRILNLSARLWRDDAGNPWLLTAPMIVLLPNHTARKAYPLDRDEERLLLNHLPAHLNAPCLYAANTGTREQEVCGLRWEWERQVSGLNGTTVFIIPGHLTGSALQTHATESGQQEVLFRGAKNGQDRIVGHNRIAQSIIDKQRGQHPDWVFPYEGRRRLELHVSSWDTGRIRAAKAYKEELGRECPEGFRRIRVHDLKHTFGRRLRAAGVSFEDRQDLLGHAGGRVTTEYSAAEIENLINAANRVCEGGGNRPSLTLLAIASGTANPAKLPQAQ